MPLPLCSSRELLRAFKRLGFRATPASKRTSGTHVTVRKDDATGARTTTLILGKKEIPRGTLRGILDDAGVSEDEFLRALGRRGRDGRR